MKNLEPLTCDQACFFSAIIIVVDIMTAQRSDAQTTALQGNLHECVVCAGIFSYVKDPLATVSLLFVGQSSFI